MWVAGLGVDSALRRLTAGLAGGDSGSENLRTVVRTAEGRRGHDERPGAGVQARVRGVPCECVWGMDLACLHAQAWGGGGEGRGVAVLCDLAIGCWRAAGSPLAPPPTHSMGLEGGARVGQ